MISMAVTMLFGLIIRYVLSRLVSKKSCLIVDYFALVVVFLAIAAESHLMYKGYHMVAARAIPGFIGLGFLLFRILHVVKRGELQRWSKIKTSKPPKTTASTM
jgi:hypothetical protein